MTKRPIMAAIGLAAAATLVATPAFASVSISDVRGDVIDLYEDVDDSSFTYTDSGDITSAVVTYSDSALNVRINYADLSELEDSVVVAIDTNNDDDADWVLGSIDGSEPVISSISDSSKTTEGKVTSRVGANGYVSLSASSKAFGSPKSIRIQALSYWSVDSTDDSEPLYDADMVPNSGWSAKIARESVKVIKPSAKPAATKVTAKLSKSTQHYKKSPVKLTASESPKTKGIFLTYDGSKVLKKQTVSSGKFSYKFSKKLKKGTHKIKVVFKPSNTKKWKSSTSKILKLTVKK